MMCASVKKSVMIYKILISSLVFHACATGYNFNTMVFSHYAVTQVAVFFSNLKSIFFYVITTKFSNIFSFVLYFNVSKCIYHHHYHLVM